MTTTENCAECGASIAEHVGRRPCLPAVRSTARNIWDLPVFGWAWSEDGKDTQS